MNISERTENPRYRTPDPHFRKLQKSFKAKEVVLSLKTENQAEAIPLALKLAANFKATLLDIQNGKIAISCYSELITLLGDQIASNTSHINAVKPSPAAIVSESFDNSASQKTPLLSTVIDDFLKRYDREKKAALTGVALI